MNGIWLASPVSGRTSRAMPQERALPFLELQRRVLGPALRERPMLQSCGEHSVDVLDEQRCWLELSEVAQVGRERRGGTGVSESAAKARCRERLARRAAGEEGELARLQLELLPQRARVDVLNRAREYGDDRVTSSVAPLKGPGACVVHFDLGERSPSRHLKAEVEPAGAREQRDEERIANEHRFGRRGGAESGEGRHW